MIDGATPAGSDQDSFASRLEEQLRQTKSDCETKIQQEKSAVERDSAIMVESFIDAYVALQLSDAEDVVRYTKEAKGYYEKRKQRLASVERLEKRLAAIEQIEADPEKLKGSLRAFLESMADPELP
jgi:vacuolar-type H+-ATPase subunit I/STV1